MLILILNQFAENDIPDLSFLQPRNIYQAFEDSNDKRNFGYPMRSFLRYLYKIGKLSIDYSGCVPSFRKNHPVPSIYTNDELRILLESFDRSTITGKRNYAIVLLALRLGIRVGDIVELRIKDIDFQQKKIRFKQKKTQVPQSLELLPEIEYAITDYLTKAKPSSDFPNVFLSLRPPIRPMRPCSIHNFIQRNLVKSGIETGKRKRGSHALRMTLASELIAENVPYNVVSKILGHGSPLSTKNYVSFDIESLRTCSINVPPLSGSIAKLIAGDMKGVPL